MQTEDLPVHEHKETNKDISLQSNQTFSEAGLNAYITKCYKRLGYVDPTPIQYFSVSTYLRQQSPSIIAQSKSGTGKTLSYLSILLSHLITLKEVGRRCSYLILLPTRELSLQVFQTLKEILNMFTQVKAQNQAEKEIKSKLMQIRTLMCIGGIPFEDDKRNYCTNGGTVLIGTIGRLLEFVDKKLIKVSELEMVILDEGDIMFQNKNSKLSVFLENALNFTRNHNHQIVFLVYSATFTTKLMKQLTKRRDFTYIQTLAQGHSDLSIKITKDFNELVGLDSIIAQKQTAEAIINLDNIKKYKITISDDTQSYFSAKIAVLTTILKELSFQRCLVFVEKKTLLEQINERLIEATLDPLLIHGSLSQSSRIKIMNEINHSKIIIASDLLARGIDLELDLVILFDARKNDTFWHRIGRTGRFGSLGVAISLDFIDDWKDYEKGEVQEQLDLIEKTFKKNKEWYGTYMTELGSWNETNQEKEVALQKQFKYFDQAKHSQGRKMVKRQENSFLEPVPTQGRPHQTKCEKALINLSLIKSREQLIEVIKSVLDCQKCLKWMKSIEEVTGYSFKIKKQDDSIS